MPDQLFPEEITVALYRINATGSFGQIVFSSGGSAPKYESIFQVRNGEEVFVKE